jgi:hypothetical protein
VLFQPKSGPLVLFYKVGPSPSQWWGMIMTSPDGGKTWGAPRRLPDGILGPVKNKPVELADGAWLSASSTEGNKDGWLVHFELSRDQGATWEKIGPVKKGPAASFDAEVPDRGSMLYEGTSIAAGRATAVVVATGDETEARRGSNTSRRDIATSGVELRLRSLINLTGPIALGAGAALITTGALRGRRLKEVVALA